MLKSAVQDNCCALVAAMERASRAGAASLLPSGKAAVASANESKKMTRLERSIGVL